jgi:hypothetical protein
MEGDPSKRADWGLIKDMSGEAPGRSPDVIILNDRLIFLR